MVNFMITAAPTSILFVAIVFFLGLMFKIATQNVRFKQRSRKYMMRKFFICLALTLMLLPVVTVISIGDSITSSFVFRTLPVLIAALTALSCVHAFLDVLRYYPKDEPEKSKTDALSEEPS